MRTKNKHFQAVCERGLGTSSAEHQFPTKYMHCSYMYVYIYLYIRAGRYIEKFFSWMFSIVTSREDGKKGYLNIFL